MERSLIRATVFGKLINCVHMVGISSWIDLQICIRVVLSGVSLLSWQAC